jgi:hypothetical protein
LFQNETSGFLAEFNARKRLAELGYMSSLDELDSETAEAFILISCELDRLEADENKKRASTPKRR